MIQVVVIGLLIGGLWFDLDSTVRNARCATAPHVHELDDDAAVRRWQPKRLNLGEPSATVSVIASHESAQPQQCEQHQH